MFSGLILLATALGISLWANATLWLLWKDQRQQARDLYAALMNAIATQRGYQGPEIIPDADDPQSMAGQVLGIEHMLARPSLPDDREVALIDG